MVRGLSFALALAVALCLVALPAAGEDPPPNIRPTDPPPMEGRPPAVAVAPLQGLPSTAPSPRTAGR